MKILIVEDDPDISELVTQAMIQSDYRVQTCANVSDAQGVIKTFGPDCLIVDWMLPDSSGIELIRWLRRQPAALHTPVLMLTARSQESDKIAGLDSGADDYMTKPMSLRELRSRVKALLRRPSAYVDTSHRLQAGPITLDTATHEVRIAQKPVELTKTEFKLLKFFLHNRDKVFTRDQILNAIWGSNAYLGERTVDVHILRLRKILKRERLENMIVTVRGAGYRFTETASA